MSLSTKSELVGSENGAPIGRGAGLLSRGFGETRGIVLPVAVAAFVVIAWQLAVDIGHVPSVILPSPLEVLRTIGEERRILLKHAIPTTSESALGFAIASLLGIVLAIMITYSQILKEALYPNLVFFQLIPKIALAPLFIIWLGIGIESRLAFSVFISFFPVVIATSAGFANVDPNMVRLCRAHMAKEWQIFLGVRLPFALPYIFSGMKVAMTLAIIGVIIGEFITAQAGLGYLIIFATSRADTAVSLAAIAVLCFCGLVLYGLVALAERFLARLYGSQVE
ncbi:MAG TPA: ABC transporter permease [Alphaproteobacteria bacterium]|nr:ABC transporter permease [Alphaproteobacteria bacterium]